MAAIGDTHHISPECDLRTGCEAFSQRNAFSPACAVCSPDRRLHQLRVRFAGSSEFRCNGSQPVETFLVTPANTASTRKFLLNLETFLLSPVDSFVFKMGTDEVIPIPAAPSTVGKSLNQRSDFGLCPWDWFARKKAFEDFHFLVPIIADANRRVC